MPVLLGPCWVPRCVFFRGGALSIAHHKVGGRQCAWVTAGNPLTHSNHTRTHARKPTEEHCGQVSQREKQKGGAREKDPNAGESCLPSHRSTVWKMSVVLTP